MCFQITQLGMEVAIIYYGGYLVVTKQMTSGGLISFFIYVLELAESLEVFHTLLFLSSCDYENTTLS